MIKFIPLTFCVWMLSMSVGFTQINARLVQQPDVSDQNIVFSYGDDLWLVNKSGGTAQRLTTPEGPEFYPRFSPDGKWVAYSANYEGNYDVYVISIQGGIPMRLTYHGMNDRTLGWTPDGKSVLFASGRESGKQRFSQFYTVPAMGGPITKLPVPYGEYASFSPDGTKLAYTDKSRVQRNWKRYRGGTAADVLIFDLKTFETTNITKRDANDELPMWIGNDIFFMSDAGPNLRNNIWKYSSSNGQLSQLTEIADYDMTFPNSSSSEIVYESGGVLYLYNIANGQNKEVPVEVISDQKNLMPTLKNVANYISGASIAPDGNRVLVEARGEIFDLPAAEGVVKNMTQTSGAAERSPEWSPDGKKMAYWSDESGEYQLMIKDMSGNSKARKITNFKSGFFYNIYWSKDSKHIVSVNQAMEITLINTENGSVKVADKGIGWLHGGLVNFKVDWSPDSRYFVYSKQMSKKNFDALFVYDTQAEKAIQLTSGFYSDQSPAFSADGKYIFYVTNRNYSPSYAGVDNTFIYANSGMLAVAPVNSDIPSLMPLENDEWTKSEEKPAEEEKPKKKKKKGKKDTEENGKENKTVVIDPNGFEMRTEMLPLPGGNYTALQTTEGKLFFVKFPNTGAGDGEAVIMMFDLKEKEAKPVLEGSGGYMLSADGKKMLVFARGQLAVVNASPGTKIDKSVPTKDMTAYVIPKEEWNQIFNEVWRLERDYFYDEDMHGVDWPLMKERYGKMLESASSRNDVNIIIGDLIAELNASHTYNGGGDIESGNNLSVGYLGADFTIQNGAYRLKQIVMGAPWDIEVKSPLLKAGQEMKTGEYLIAVNGIPVSAQLPISAAFQGLSGKTVQLTISASANGNDSRNIIVKPLSTGEMTRLRNLEWINTFRKRVEEASEGKLGYIYVPSTGVDGQNELFRQFYGQMDKDGLIIDERFNNGGQIPDRFIELLDRDPLAFWAIRDGEEWSWPPAGHFGPKVMLINGFAGSGGDAFPDYFRKREIGPLIGTRTWGGLIGISGAPSLIDGGTVTVPTFRMYDPDGVWFKEGHGVDPDIKVMEDFEQLANGTDAQLEAAIKEAMRLLNSKDSFVRPARPDSEKRN